MFLNCHMISNNKKLYFIFALCLLSEINSLNNESSSELIETSINNEKDFEYEINPDVTYKFIIENKNYIYCFSDNSKNLIHIQNKDNILETTRNNLYFEKGEIIYINHLLNLEESITIKISAIPLYDILNTFETINEDKYFSIKSEKESIAYFDSVDKNAKYIFLIMKKMLK